jgi:hypothetical protein
MLDDIQAAESLVAVFVIFSECPIDREESVAHVSVAPLGWFPIFQNEGNDPSIPPIFQRFCDCAIIEALVTKNATLNQQ